MSPNNKDKLNQALGKIPERAMLIKIMPPGCVFFPHMERSMHFEGVTEEAGNRLRNSPYAVVAPMRPNFEAYSMGSLAKIFNVRTDPENSENIGFEILTLLRVRFEVVERGNGYTLVRWYPILDYPPSPEVTHDPKTQQTMSFLRDLFVEFVSGVDKNTGPDVPDFSEHAIVKGAMEKLTHLDINNLSEVLDRIMNTVNLVNFDGKVDIAQPSLVVLQQENLLFRLINVVELLHILLYEGPIIGEDDDEEDEEKDLEETTSTSQRVSDLVERPVRQVIAEDLLKPREVKPRFPPLEEPPREGVRFIELIGEPESEFRRQYDAFMNQRVIDQERGKDQIYQILLDLKIGIEDEGGAIPGGIFFGPTGSGKTSMVRALAEFVFGDPDGFVKISCETLQEKHELSKLLGAPPGYVGYDEEPVWSQWKLDKAHFLKILRDKYADDPQGLAKILAEIKDIETQMTEKKSGYADVKKKMEARLRLKKLGWKPGEYFSIVLFDEIEKAHVNVTKALLQIFDDGTLSLQNGEVIIFKNTAIFGTSNLYAQQIADAVSGKRKMGIRPDVETTQADLEKELYDGVLCEAERTFLPEFLGRIGKENLRVFYSLSREDLLKILNEIRLPQYFDKLERSRYRIKAFITEATKIFLVNEAMDPSNRRLGARALRTVIRRKLKLEVNKWIEASAQGGILVGDKILIDVVEKNGGSKRMIVVKKIEQI